MRPFLLLDEVCTSVPGRLPAMAGGGRHRRGIFPLPQSIRAVILANSEARQRVYAGRSNAV